MAKNSIWCGYLDAGEKSSPVIIDQRLSTGNPDTMYVFNLRRNAILTYNRGIVEPKLREMNGDETDVLATLKSAYAKARRGFKIRPEPVTHSSGRRRKATQEKPAEDDAELITDELDAEFETVSEDDWDSDDSDD